MRSQYQWMPTLRLTLVALAALAIASPASAQFGGLKKRIKAKAGQEAVKAAAPQEQAPDAQDENANATTGGEDAPAVGPEAQAPEAQGGRPAKAQPPGGDGGMIVLTKDVVHQLLAGLNAAKTVRDGAAREDTPHSRHNKAKAAHAAAQPKCEAAQVAFFQRAATDEKMLAKYNAFNDKAVEAQGKGDTKLVAIYQDSALALQDPSCIVKEPTGVPKGYYEAERELEIRAEQEEMKASKLTRGELAVIKERTIAILQGETPEGGASASEKSAVFAKKAELRQLLGIREKPPVQAGKPAPAPSPTPVAATQPSPKMSAAAANMNDCVVKNTLKHEARLEALAERAEAAEAANETGKLMAIADTMQQIQMAGCHAE